MMTGNSINRKEHSRLGIEQSPVFPRCETALFTSGLLNYSPNYSKPPRVIPNLRVSGAEKAT